MPFDPTTAKPVKKTGFDPTTAKPVETQTSVQQTYDITGNNDIVSAPSYYSTEEVKYLNDIQNNGETDSSYFGYFKKDIGTPVDLAKGYMRGFLQMGPSVAGLMLERDERRLQRIEQLQSGERKRDWYDFLFEEGTPIWEEKKPRKLRLKEEADMLRERISGTRKGIKDMPKVIKAMGLESDTYAADVGQGIQSLVQSIGVTMITKDPKAAALFFGAQQKGSDYVEARDAGLSIEEASKASYVTAGTVGAIEMVGTSAFFKVIGEGSMIRRGLKGYLTNSTEEGAQEAAEIAIKNGYDITDIGFEQGVGQVLYAGFIGGLVGAPVAASIKTEMADSNNISLEDVERLLQIGDDISNNKDMQNVVSEQIKKAINDEFSGVKEDTIRQQEVVEQIADDYINGRELDLSYFPEAERENIAKQISEVEKGLQEIDAQEERGFLPVPRRPKTLSAFLKEKGGLRADTDETKKYRRKESPNLRGVASRNGKLSLDEARELAVEAGYILDTEYEGGESVTDYRDLLDLLDREAFGEDIVSAEDMGALQYREQVIAYNQQLDETYSEMMDTVNKVKSFKSAFRKGVSAARKDVKAAQGELINLLDKSGIEAKDKAKFIKTIKNIQTFEQLRKKSPKIQERVERILSENALAKQKEVLKKSLQKKAIKPSVQSGRKKGKFGADVQERLEKLRSASLMKQDEAAEKIGANLEKDTQDDLENKILNAIANPDAATATEYAIINAEIKLLKLKGRTINDAIKQNRGAYYERIKTEIDEWLDPQSDVLSKKRGGVAKAAKEKFVGAIRWSIGSYNDFLDSVAPPSIREDLRVGKEISERKRIIRVMNEKVVQAARDIYGSDVKNLEYVIEGSHEIQDLGVFVDMNNELQRIEISVAQARKFWMEYQDPKLVEKTIHNENGNAYTQEIADAILNLLSEKDIAFAQAQLDIYQDFYSEINKVYSDIYGINLPKTEFYSPIARETDEDIRQGLDEFNSEIAFRVEVATGTATKMRDTKATAALKKQSDIAVFNRHITEMSRFIALARKTRTLNNVFKDPQIKKKIRAKYGEKFDVNFHDILEIIARGSPVSNNPLDNTFNYFNRNFSTGVLGLKAKIGLTQLSSYFAYAETITTKQFIGGTRDFFVNYKTAIKTLSESELLKDRGASPDVDIARMGQSFDSAKLQRIKKGKENLIDYTLIFTKMGDRAAIYVGGWPVYKAAIDSGKTHEQAMAEFEAATAKTQQSKDLDQLSLMQMSNSLGRSLGMFMSAPFAQFRGEMRAVRQLRNGEIDVRKFGRQMMIYHVLVPQMYKLLSNGLIFGEFDPEDQAWTLLFGSLNSIPVLSEVLNVAARTAQGKSIGEGGAIKWWGELRDITTDLVDGFNEALEGDFEEAAEVLPEILATGGLMVGLPTPQIKQVAEGISDISDGDTKEGAMKLFGYPDSIAEGDSGEGWKSYY